MSTNPTVSRLRRQLLAKPGFTRLPVCPHCQQEIPLLQYTEHTKKCEKASRKPAQEAPALAQRSNADRPEPRGLVYGLFDPRAVRRLEKAGAQLAELRRRLRAQHDTTTPAERVERHREIARVECLAMAIVVSQVRHRFGLQGSGIVFLRHLRPGAVNEHLYEACTELVRMADPANWRTV